MGGCTQSIQLHEILSVLTDRQRSCARLHKLVNMTILMLVIVVVIVVVVVLLIFICTELVSRDIMLIYRIYNIKSKHFNCPADLINLYVHVQGESKSVAVISVYRLLFQAV
jgi:heme/copper-type cytochrome/quinol oxidase subunit 2